MPRPTPRLPVLLLAALLAALLGACATPIAPTGGPTDTTPPALAEVTPADGATGVTERTVTLTFSERLDPATARAVTVTPQGETPPEVRVSGRDLVVEFDALRDSTTYVISVGTELRDQRNVALQTPVTVAFATGDSIDRGRLAGAVRDPRTGAAAAGLAVWAYASEDTARTPDVRAAAPDYQTETGADGAFRLEYLRPGRYFVAAVADRNRNRRADPGEAFAAPPRPALTAADSSVAAPAPNEFWVTVSDTIAPVAQRVRPISDRRFAVRFSEPVRLLRPTPDLFAVTDSVSGRRAEVVPYQGTDSPFEVVVQTAAPLPPSVQRVAFAGAGAEPPALADSSGTPPASFTLSFTPTDRPDTLQTRFVGFLPAAAVAADSAQALAPRQRPGVRFSAPLAPDEVARRVALTADGEAVPIVAETTDGVSFTVRPEGDSLAGPFALAVRLPNDSTAVRRYAPLGASETGGIVGQVEAAAGRAYVEVQGEGAEPVLVPVGTDGRFAVDGLAAGAYRVRVFADLDGDGRWSGGALVPYRPPEPLRILPEPVDVRARWETELDPIRLEPSD